MQKITYYVCFIGLLLAAVGLARAEGYWPVPTNGWEHNYVAAEGSGADSGVPHQYSSLWRNGGYQTTDPDELNYAAIIPDAVEGDVLMLVHTNGSGGVSMFPYYYMTSVPGAGTTNDLITLDCRFRLADDSLSDTQEQFLLNVVRPRLDGIATGWNFWMITFSKQNLKVNGTTFNAPLGTNWHNVRLVADVARNTSWVYLDNNPVPVYSGPSSSRAHTITRNWTAFGDSGTEVNGQACVKYLRWTTTELVHPSTYLQHVGDADPLTEGFTYKPVNLEYAASNNVFPEDASPSWGGSPPGNWRTILNDEVTGETTLHLDMTSKGHWCAQYNEAGQFATNDLVDVDFRFRLVDDSQAEDQAQLMLSLVGPRPDGIGAQQLFFCRFAKGHIDYFDNTTLLEYPITLGTNWHNVNWRVNWNTREAEMYLDDNPVEAFSHRSRLYTTATNNYTAFGSNSAQVRGIARVSYLRVTRQTPTWQGGVEEDATPYWQGADGDGSFGYYEGAVPAEVMNYAEGWTASCKLRLLETSHDAFGVTIRCFDQANKWDLILKTDGCYYQNADGGLIRLGPNSRPMQYHTFQMHYDPAGDGGNGAVSYYKNGWLIETLTRADTFTNGSSEGLFQWGFDSVPSATSTVRWNLVELARGNQVIAPIPPDGTLIFVR